MAREFLLLLYAAFIASLLSGAALAAEKASEAAAATKRFATVMLIRGEVTVSAGDTGPMRTLRQGEAVFVGERVRTGVTGEAVLKTEDAGLIALRPRAEFVMERYLALGNSNDVFSLRLIAGGLRVITGWIGVTNRAGQRIATNTVTIGIRGTDHEPYAMTAELAATLSQNDGVYDKVNRGGTTMDVKGNTLDIDPGRVGFVRDRPFVMRGLLTVLLPVLLDRVPDFYVAGAFETELDRLSATVDADALRALGEVRRSSPERSPDAIPEPVAPAVPEPSVTPEASPTPGPESAPRAAGDAPAQGSECAANDIARQWLAEFDNAIERRDAQAIMSKFASEVSIRVTVRDASGQLITVELGRDELARSAIAAVAGLTDYQQRRPSIEGRPAGEGARLCERISVRSVAIEQGKQSGKPYRFESLEEFLLEWRGGVWLAITATTTQR